jgi:ankyrin repeat protein
VELLLQNGASPDFEDMYGRTALARVVENGNVAVLRLLLARGVKIDHKYNIVSKSISEWVSTKLMTNTVTLCYCRE